jgi:hypothetical protein
MPPKGTIERPSNEGLLQNTDLKAAFEDLAEDELLDAEYMADFVYRRIGCRLNRGSLRLPDNFVTSSNGLQCKQYPFELGSLLAFVYRNRFAINSYLEIGVERGGTFFAVDSLLRAHNPTFQGSVGIDVTSQIKNNGYAAYHAVFPDCSFLQSDSKMCQRYSADLVFIDGDHSFAGVSSDFERFRSGARFVGIHDIFFPKAPGVNRFWREVKLQHRTEEFVASSELFPVSVGIGLIHV